MIAFLLALLVWMLGGGPAPTPHGLTVPPATTAPAHGGSRGTLTGARANTSVDPIAPPTPAPTVATAPPTNGEELQTVMCTDPIDCPPGQ